MTIESSGIPELVETLTKAASRSIREVEKVVFKGAMNVKEDWRKRWSGLAHAPAIPAAIDFDIYSTPSAVNAEIGPDKSKRQGALGNLLAFGSVNNAPVPGPIPAARAEEPRFAAALEALGADLLGER